MYEILINTLLLIPDISKAKKKMMVEELSLSLPNITETDLFSKWPTDLLYMWFTEVISEYAGLELKYKISYETFLKAYYKAGEIYYDSKELGYDIFAIDSKMLPSKLRKIMDPLTVLYVKGDINLMNKNMLGCYGKENCSQFVEKSCNRIGSRITENEVVLVANLEDKSDLKVLEGTLQSFGKIIGLLNLNNEDKHKSNMKRILQNGGCILSVHPPGGTVNFIEIEYIKIGLSDAVLIIEMDNDTVPLEEIAAQKKELFCISFPDNFKNPENEQLISSGRAKQIRGREDLIWLSKEINNIYESKHIFANCDIDFVHYQSSFEKQLTVSIKTSTNENLSHFLYDSGYTQWSTKIKLEFNNNDLKYILDKENGAYYYPLADIKIFKLNKDDNFHFRKVYFNSNYRLAYFGRTRTPISETSGQRFGIIRTT